VPLKFIKKDDFTNILDTNLISPFFLTQKLLNRKKLFTSSSIVFISSISGPIIGSKGNLMYSASKSAVNGMIKTLALELAYLKIRVNSISAGMVLTEMWDTGNDIIAIDQLRFDEKKYPLGYGKPKDIASIVLFLVSDGSTWITGSTIIADGGFTIQ
jgi:NAD(P)-dependent dehydrogenase (short-subunit alcohol dehydrogenase family)